MLLSTLKNKLIAAGAAIIAGLLVTVQFLMKSRRRALESEKRVKAALSRKEDIEDIDSDLSKDLKSHKAEIAKELKEGENVTSLSDPNSWD